MILSSGTDCSPTRPSRWVRGWRSGRHGGSGGRGLGGPDGGGVGRWLVVQVREEAGVATAGMPGAPVHEELCTVTDEDGWVRYEFTADELNQLWLTDITEHRSAEGRLYFCAIKDVFANRIVGYFIDSRMESTLA